MAHRSAIFAVALVWGWLALLAVPPTDAQPGLKFQRDRGQAMLRVVRDDIRKNYFDPQFRGMDLEAAFAAAERKIAVAESNGQIFAAIAQAVMDLDDSHTYFVPPPRASRIEYGLEMTAVADRVFVTAVRPGCDAEAKGVAVGDEVLAVNGFAMARKDLTRFAYIFYLLVPQPRLTLALRAPGGGERQVEVAAKVREGALVTELTGEEVWRLIREAQEESRLHAHRYAEVGDGLLVWKMPAFDDEDVIASMIGRARKRPLLILDLRGNPGGLLRVLQWMAGYLFDREVAIADLAGRRGRKPQMPKRLGVKDYAGKLVVLVDSGSASAAEILARVVQLEKRGVVLGDRTAGAVMQSRMHGHELGMDTVVYYGVSVTENDVIMADGTSLEGRGVTPDELLLPSAEDLAAHRDPVLARAAALLGVSLSPEEAGRMFPVQWKK